MVCKKNCLSRGLYPREIEICFQNTDQKFTRGIREKIVYARNTRKFVYVWNTRKNFHTQIMRKKVCCLQFQRQNKFSLFKVEKLILRYLKNVTHSAYIWQKNWNAWKYLKKHTKNLKYAHKKYSINKCNMKFLKLYVHNKFLRFLLISW